MQGWTSAQIAGTIAIGATPMLWVALKWTPFASTHNVRASEGNMVATDYSGTTLSNDKPQIQQCENKAKWKLSSPLVTVGLCKERLNSEPLSNDKGH
jgi:hypothetical protein